MRRGRARQNREDNSRDASLIDGGAILPRASLRDLAPESVRPLGRASKLHDVPYRFRRRPNHPNSGPVQSSNNTIRVTWKDVTSGTPSSRTLAVTAISNTVRSQAPGCRMQPSGARQSDPKARTGALPGPPSRPPRRQNGRVRKLRLNQTRARSRAAVAPHRSSIWELPRVTANATGMATAAPQHEGVRHSGFLLMKPPRRSPKQRASTGQRTARLEEWIGCSCSAA